MKLNDSGKKADEIHQLAHITRNFFVKKDFLFTVLCMFLLHGLKLNSVLNIPSPKRQTTKPEE